MENYFLPYISLWWYDEGKEVKRRKLNQDGENMYLNDDGTITDELKHVIRCQQIFKHEYYKPGGKGARKLYAKNKDVKF